MDYTMEELLPVVGKLMEKYITWILTYLRMMVMDSVKRMLLIV